MKAFILGEGEGEVIYLNDTRYDKLIILGEPYSTIYKCIKRGINTITSLSNNNGKSIKYWKTKVDRMVEEGILERFYEVEDARLVKYKVADHIREVILPFYIFIVK